MATVRAHFGTEITYRCVCDQHPRSAMHSPCGAFVHERADGREDDTRYASDFLDNIAHISFRLAALGDDGGECPRRVNSGGCQTASLSADVRNAPRADIRDRRASGPLSAICGYGATQKPWRMRRVLRHSRELCGQAAAATFRFRRPSRASPCLPRSGSALSAACRARCRVLGPRDQRDHSPDKCDRDLRRTTLDKQKPQACARGFVSGPTALCVQFSAAS